jgi:glycosyltransferase involved in cell wall biosynthesis
MNLTVAIPVYQRTTFLEAALASVERASLRHSGRINIVIVDNASTAEPMTALLATLAARGVTVVRNATNLGAIGNWNRCLEVATGEWLHLLHDDDYIHEDMYAEAAAVADGPCGGIGMIVFDALSVDERARPIQAVTSFALSGVHHAFRVEQAHKNLVCNPGVIFRREMGLQVGGFSTDGPQYLADWGFWFKLALRSDTYVCKKTMAFYRVHGGSGTLNDNQFSIHACARFVDMNISQLAAEDRKILARYAYTAGFGRHLIGLYRERWRWREAMRLAVETLKVEPRALNFAKVLKKLLVK